MSIRSQISGEEKCTGSIDLYNGSELDSFYDVVQSDGRLGKECINWNQYYTECKDGPENPFKGAISFDNIGYAWIAIFQAKFLISHIMTEINPKQINRSYYTVSELFQVISLEGWVDIMYYVMDAHSFFSFIYFILLIVIGSFFMINLCLVVIATQFSETKQREQRLMEEGPVKI